MRTKILQTVSDAWIYVKIKLHIPLPFKNHFYKGRRISMKRNWFCTNCDSVFHLLPWKEHKDDLAGNVRCPSCGTRSVVWSTFLFMAIVEKKPKEYLHWLLKLTPEEIIIWISKHKTQ